MQITKLKECGYEEALLGISLSYNQPLDKMKKVAETLSSKDGGHNKFLESIYLWIDVTAPRFWWQNADTYRLSTKQSECFSDDTEVLTDRGWFLFKDVPKNAKYATLNIDTKLIEYQKEIRRIESRYIGKIINFRNSKVDLMVTPNHDLIGNTKPSENIKKYSAEQINNIFIPKCGTFSQGKNINNFKLPRLESRWNTGFRDCNIEWKEKSLDIKSWMWFLGFFLAEGRTEKNSRNYNTYLYQNSNSPYCETIDNHLNNLSFNFSKFYKKPHKVSGKVLVRWTISNKQLYEFLKPLGDTYNKHIPLFVFDLNKELQKIFFEGMFAGDGSKSTGRYSTVSKQLADDTQRLLRNIGVTSNISFYKNKNSKIGGIYAVNIQKTSFYKLEKRDKNIIDYNGVVYCVEVPNGTLYTRRNGKAIWSGNSTMHTIMRSRLTQEHFEYPIDEGLLRELNNVIDYYNAVGDIENSSKIEKDFYFMKIKNLLPEGFLQRRIWVLNYKSLKNIYEQRKNHKLPQWKKFCKELLEQIEHPEFIN